MGLQHQTHRMQTGGMYNIYNRVCTLRVHQARRTDLLMQALYRTAGIRYSRIKPCYTHKTPFCFRLHSDRRQYWEACHSLPQFIAYRTSRLSSSMVLLIFRVMSKLSSFGRPSQPLHTAYMAWLAITTDRQLSCLKSVEVNDLYLRSKSSRISSR